MKKLKLRLMPFLLLAALSLTACDALRAGTPSAGSTAETTSAQMLSPPNPAVNTIFGIGYKRNSSGYLNPITEYAELNAGLFALMYDGLFKLDGNFAPQSLLCDSITLDGTTVTIKIKSGVLFHDGSALTAADVVYSLQLAKNSADSIYANRLKAVQDIWAADSSTVIITLSSPRGSVASLLDIPVIKKNTGITDDAVGCGRYELKSDNDVLYLMPFDDYYGGVSEDPALDYILLTEVTDNNILEYGVISGNVDLLRVNLLPKNGVYIYANADKIPADTSDLFYIGFNTKSGPASSLNLRKAVRLLVDVGALREEAFGGHLRRSWGLYPLSLFPGAAAGSETSPDVSAAQSLLSAAGYFYSSSGVFKTAGGSELKLRIAVMDTDYMIAAANRMSAMLAAGGIGSEVNALSGSAFESSLESADFDLYIGEIDVAPDFDFTFLLGSGGSANYGGFYDGETETLLAGFAQNGISFSEDTAALISEKLAADVPIIPIGYRVDYVYIRREYGIGNVTVTESDPFYNVFDWTIN